MDKKEETFRYSYSAEERTEVENIRKKYLPRQENKMEQLRRLDSVPQQKAQTVALCLGVIGTLLLGCGMSLFMSDLGSMLGLAGGLVLPLGIGIGVAGLVLVALAYPAYDRILKRERTRIAPEILRLTEELMK